MAAVTRFDLLGPLTVRRDGHLVRVGSARERVLLGVLLIRANQVVSADELVDWLWPDASPRDARAALQTYVWRLRKRLGGPTTGGLDTRPQGYVLTTRNRDLDELRALVARAENAEPAEAARLLGRAVRLWRGPPLADVPCDRLHRDLVPPLTEELLGVRHRRIEAELAAGRHAVLVPELRALVAEHPLREGFWAQLMRALCRDGRPAEALAAYEQVRRLIAEELGADPGAQLRAAYAQALRGGAGPDAEPGPGEKGGPGTSDNAGPAGPAGATGGGLVARGGANRTFEVDRLIALASAHRRLGRHAEADACLTDAARIAGEIGYRRAEAAARAALTDVRPPA